MHEIADNPVTDINVSAGNPGSVCQDQTSDASHKFFNESSQSSSTNDLATIFKQIGTSLASTRLISNTAA